MKDRSLLSFLSLLVLASIACGFFQRQVGRAADVFFPVHRASVATDLPRGIFVKSAPEDHLAGLCLNNGRMFLLLEGAGNDSGTYIISGSQLIVDTDFCAVEGYGPGYYEWTYDAGILSLAAASPDPCTAREAELSGTYSLHALP